MAKILRSNSVKFLRYEYGNVMRVLEYNYLLYLLNPLMSSCLFFKRLDGL